MTMLDTENLDIQGVRQAVRKGDMCEVTTALPLIHLIERPLMGGSKHRNRSGNLAWALVVLGTVLIFISIIGLGTIGVFLWLSSAGG